MSEEKGKTIKIELPEGTIEARGSDRFLEQVRGALVPVLTGQVRVQPHPIGTTSEREIVEHETAQRETGLPLRRMTTIRDLYAEKRPETDTQTAALIAYYLSELAPPQERSDTVDTDIVLRYFRLCPRPLPVDKRSLLPNAKRDGYLDSAAERGKYKLNAIGYNLVVHGLPASPAAPETTSRRPRRVRRLREKKTGRPVGSAGRTRRGKAN